MKEKTFTVLVAASPVKQTSSKKDVGATTFGKMTFRITPLSIKGLFVTLSIIDTQHK